MKDVERDSGFADSVSTQSKRPTTSGFDFKTAAQFQREVTLNGRRYLLTSGPCNEYRITDLGEPPGFVGHGLNSEVAALGRLLFDLLWERADAVASVQSEQT